MFYRIKNVIGWRIRSGCDRRLEEVNEWWEEVVGVLDESGGGYEEGEIEMEYFLLRIAN